MPRAHDAGRLRDGGIGSGIGGPERPAPITRGMTDAREATRTQRGHDNAAGGWAVGSPAVTRLRRRQVETKVLLRENAQGSAGSAHEGAQGRAAGSAGRYRTAERRAIPDPLAH